MSTKYTVSFSPFTDRHFIKRFQKKYKRAWDVTYEALVREFKSIDVLFSRSIAEVIVQDEDFKICKSEFKVAQTNKSRHASGNRCILAIHNKQHYVEVLLVYNKNDLPKGNETANWKKIVKSNYPEYSHLF